MANAPLDGDEQRIPWPPVPAVLSILCFLKVADSAAKNTLAVQIFLQVDVQALTQKNILRQDDAAFGQFQLTCFAP